MFFFFLHTVLSPSNGTMQSNNQIIDYLQRLLITVPAITYEQVTPVSTEQAYCSLTLVIFIHNR